MDNRLLLLGNGFSMNFDSSFCNVMDRLYEAHKEVLMNGVVKAKANKNYKTKFEESYNSVVSALRRVNKDKLYKILEEGFELGQAIIQDTNFIKELKETEYVTDLEFGNSQLTMLDSLIKSWEKCGINRINIEYISILVWAYFAAGEEKIKEYDMQYNGFVKLVRIGDYQTKKVLKGDAIATRLLENIMFNGVTTYLRMLLATAIFNNGKAIADNEFDKINKINLDKIKNYLNEFDVIITLNYDKIVENLFNINSIKHVHGEYKRNKEECNYQLLGLKYKDSFINFSDILVGDYIYNKTQRAIVNGLNAKHTHKNYKTWKEILETKIKENKINNITILGLSSDNDQHIFRDIITRLHLENIENPEINYCYFNEQDKKSFIGMYDSIQTFGEELNNYAKQIKINYIKTKDILKRNFLC